MEFRLIGLLLLATAMGILWHGKPAGGGYERVTSAIGFPGEVSANYIAQRHPLPLGRYTGKPPLPRQKPILTTMNQPQTVVERERLRDLYLREMNAPTC